jgi:hypothetical protein
MTFPSAHALGVQISQRFGLAARRRQDITEEAEWDDSPQPQQPAPEPCDWLFWSFFMCMAVAALPLVGIRWTTPEGAHQATAFEDALLLALPVVLPLPFLLIGCVATLAWRPSARTPGAWIGFGAALALGSAALHALTS